MNEHPIPPMDTEVTDIQRILIDLDSILDTRYGVLFKHNALAAAQALKDKQYYSRLNNDFTWLGAMDVVTFQKLFDERDWEVLKDSPPTGFIFALRTMIDDLADQRKNSPFADECILTVNTFPYELHPAEATEMAKLIGVFTGLGEKRIQMVSIPLANLSPLMVKQQFTGMIIYNFREWMELQQDAFLRHNMPQIVVLAPGLYKGPIPDPSEYQIKGFEQMTPFELSEGALVGCFDLSFLGMKFFSAIPPEELAQATAQVRKG